MHRILYNKYTWKHGVSVGKLCGNNDCEGDCEVVDVYSGGSSCELVVGRIGVDSNAGDAVFPATSKFFRFSTSALFFIHVCSTALILCKKVKITNICMKCPKKRNILSL